MNAIFNAVYSYERMRNGFFNLLDLLKDSLSLEQFLLIRITYGELTRGELHLAQVNNSKGTQYPL